MMSKWKKFLQEEVSPSHEDKVLKAAASLLQQNASIAKEAAGKRGFRWVYLLAPGLTLAALAIILIPRNAVSPTQPEALSPEIEIALDLEMYQDLREIESLELLKKLGEPNTWQTKKQKTQKS